MSPIPPASSPLLLCFGEILWDLLPTGPQLGGAPANGAVHAQALGIPTRLISAIGDDLLGNKIGPLLQTRGLSTELIQVLPGTSTGTVEVHLSAQGSPSYLIRENVAWDAIAWKPELEKAARAASALCFGSLAQRSPLSRQTLQRLLATVPPNCLRFFDVNLRNPLPDPATITASLRQSTILKLNDEEAPLLARLMGLAGTSVDSLVSHLLKNFPLQLIVMTLGKEGAWLWTPAQKIFIPPTPVPAVVDTIGAGDAFSAGLLSALLQGRPLAEAGNQAAELAARVCGCSGAWLPLSPSPSR